MPTVTAVITTMGSSLLLRAVRSALDQTYPALDVIVCVDGPGGGEVAKTLTDPRVRVLQLPRRVGQREVRLQGVRASKAEYIAFLDDDDRWYQTKIERQVAAAMAIRAQGLHPIVLCRSNRVAPDGRHLQVSPRRTLPSGARVADWLLVRRELRPESASAITSMFLMPRALLLDLPPLPGDAFMTLDWPMLIALDERPQVRIEMLEDVLLDYVIHPIGHSESSSRAWPASYEMFDQWRQDHTLTRREWADGLLWVTAVLAVEQDDRRGALRIARRVQRGGGGSWRAWVFFALCFLLPKRLRAAINETVEKVTTRRAGQ
jgi:glycosyltransferase involved in cell wall biosynthesis